MPRGDVYASCVTLKQRHKQARAQRWGQWSSRAAARPRPLCELCKLKLFTKWTCSAPTSSCPRACRRPSWAAPCRGAAAGPASAWRCGGEQNRGGLGGCWAVERAAAGPASASRCSRGMVGCVKSMHAADTTLTLQGEAWDTAARQALLGALPAGCPTTPPRPTGSTRSLFCLDVKHQRVVCNGVGRVPGHQLLPHQRLSQHLAPRPQPVACKMATGVGAGRARSGGRARGRGKCSCGSTT